MENPSHDTVLVIRDLNVIAAELDIPQTVFAKSAIEKAAVSVEVTIISLYMIFTDVKHRQ